MNVLLTGFEPFDKDPLNPSWEVARALGGWQPAAMNAACTVRAVQLPCVFGDAIARLDEAMAQWQPALVICLGLAGGRKIDAWTGQHRCAIVPFEQPGDDPHAFFNANTLAELHRLEGSGAP